MRLVKYSIIRGGLFYRLEERLKFVDANDSRVVTRAGIFALLTWFPLVMLANFQGLAINDDPHRSVLLDYSVYGRFLIAVPILIAAENLVENRYVIIASYFLNSGILPEGGRPQYLSILLSSQRLVISPIVEVILLVAAYSIVALSVSADLHSATSTWVRTDSGALSIAAFWYALVSLPLFHFLLLRWGWRFLIWCISLWRLARLDLRLMSTHPDSAGGLGILSESINAFAPILFAVSVLVSSFWCKSVVYDGVPVTEFHRPFLVFLFVALLSSVMPLLVFTSKLIALKLRGLHDYGVLANCHSLMFDEKWIEQGEENIESVLGTPDISSLCDLKTDYQTVQTMKFFPFRLQNLIFLAGAVCLPMFPLVLLEIPLKDLIFKIGGALL